MQSYIGLFGGNASQVTISGISAGGVSDLGEKRRGVSPNANIDSPRRLGHASVNGVRWLSWGFTLQQCQSWNRIVALMAPNLRHRSLPPHHTCLNSINITTLSLRSPTMLLLRLSVASDPLPYHRVISAHQYSNVSRGKTQRPCKMRAQQSLARLVMEPGAFCLSRMECIFSNYLVNNYCRSKLMA